MCGLSPLASFYSIIIIIIIIIIIVVVVVVHDDTNYWVYLSSDHLFQVYYKVQQVLLKSETAFFITKCDKCYYKVRQVLQSVTILLQSAKGITKCDDYYKVRQYTPPWQKGRLMEPLPGVFDMLPYFETILPSVKSLWFSQQDEVYFIGGGATGGTKHSRHLGRLLGYNQELEIR